MRFNLRTEFSATILAVVVFSMVSSVIATFFTWHVGGLLRDAVEENLPSMQVASELQMRLCEPRGFLASYILDGGDREWLAKLEKSKQEFSDRLRLAKTMAHTAAEKTNLAKLEAVHRRYDAKRDEAIALYDAGNIEVAKDIALKDVNDLYEEAYLYCQEFLAANQGHVDAKTAEAQSDVSWAMGTVSTSVALTVGLGGLLLWLFFQRVVRPLRRMVADAQVFWGQDFSAGPPQDELRAVGEQLRALMCDVTDTRGTLERSRNQLRHAEKLASVGKLAASVAHEIRNPLTAMKMWVFSIRKAVQPRAELGRKFQLLSDEMARLEGIIRNFLEFSRPPALNARAESIDEILDRTLELVHYQMEEKGVRVDCERAPELPSVMADPEQLRQVIVNLLSNAAEAMCEGGEICIRTCLKGNAGKMVVVRIQDDGPGMSEEVRERIFEPFFTTKENGTGLGLCVAAGIMARHGGRLVLESSDGEGTSFEIWIPAAAGGKHE